MRRMKYRGSRELRRQSGGGKRRSSGGAVELCTALLQHVWAPLQKGDAVRALRQAAADAGVGLGMEGVQDKLESSSYSTVEEFRADVQQVVASASRKPALAQGARALQAECEQLLERHGEALGEAQRRALA